MDAKGDVWKPEMGARTGSGFEVRLRYVEVGRKGGVMSGER